MKNTENKTQFEKLVDAHFKSNIFIGGKHIWDLHKSTFNNKKGTVKITVEGTRVSKEVNVFDIKTQSELENYVKPDKYEL